LEVRVEPGKPEEFATELLALYVFEGANGEQTAPAVSAVDRALGGAIQQILDSGDFRGKLEETSLYYTRGAIPARRVLLVGMGKREKFGADQGRRAAAAACRLAAKLGVKTFATASPFSGVEGIGTAECAQATAEGLFLGGYLFKKYKTEELEELREVDECTLLCAPGPEAEEVGAGVETATKIMSAVQMSRDIINGPGSDVTPIYLAERAQELARSYGLTCTVFDRAQMEEMGMGAMLGVARGSAEPARFIVLEYNANKTDAPTFAIVGKGITFDSGGISIKPSEKLDEMKYDMAGAGVVLGVVRAAAELGLACRIVGIMPATENLPSGTALKPGDILKSLSGKTIEVVNTDAEGRLILADAVTFALRYKPTAIVDLATLTGACVIALGHHASGMLGNNPDLTSKIKAASEKTGEKVWELPLWEEYLEQLKSDVADVKNTGGRPGGTITGAAFIGKFVGDTPWVHLDIAGTAWADKERSYLAKGATAHGVRLLIQMLRDWT